METPVNTDRVAWELVRARNTVPYALALAAAGAFSFLSGGYVIGRSTPVAMTLLLALAVWIFFLRRSTRPPAIFLAALGAFAAFTVWSGMSVMWSYGPDLTWVAFNLTAFYLAVVTVLGFTSARGLQLRTVGYGFLALATAVAVYAFLGKGLPDVVTHAHVNARLDKPLGYWNVLALMMVMGLCVALAVAGDRRTPEWLRTLAAAAAVPMSFTFFFTFSRGGWLVLAAALILYFGFTTTRLASVVTLVAVVGPVAAVLWRLRDLGTLFSTTTDDALRTAQGHELLRWAVVAVVVTAAAQVAVALLQRGVAWPRWSTRVAGAVVLVAVAAALVIGPGRYVQAHGGTHWVSQRVHAVLNDTESGGANGASRLFVFTSNGRVPLWREAARQSQYVRVAGTGAGTFAFTHYRFRTSPGVVKHAHSQWFNVLSELGVVGLVLFAAAVVLLVVALVGNPFARRDDPLHPLLVALQVGVIAFVVHMSWDWDWDMAAIGTLAFVFIAVCASYRASRAGDERREAESAARVPEAESPAEWRAAVSRAAAGEIEAVGPLVGEAAPEAEHVRRAKARRRGRLGLGPRAVAAAALALLAVSWLLPYLSQRAQSEALVESSNERIVLALADARRAARLDPLAVSPLLTEAATLQQLGQYRAALATLQKAARLQPQDYSVWFALGELQQGPLGQKDAARASFTRALALNPLDAASRAELDRLGS